jgi:hypothetical protein
VEFLAEGIAIERRVAGRSDLLIEVAGRPVLI